MTNVRVMNSFTNHKYSLNIEATEKRKNRDTLSDAEIQAMLDKADQIKTKYFRLRAKAIVSIAKVFGKRRSEIASLEVAGLKIDEGELLNVTFTLRKKRKRGLFQYIQFLKKQIANDQLSRDEFNAKTQIQLEEEWRVWQGTKSGVHISEAKSTKSVNINSFFGKIIVEYLDFVKRNFPSSKYLFPAGINLFGKYAMDFNNHIGEHTVYDIVIFLDPNTWVHLFRERKGADIARKKGRTLDAVYAVKDTLDLANEATAYHYIRRYAIQEMEKDT